MKKAIFTIALLFVGLAAFSQEAPTGRDSSRMIRLVEHRFGVTNAQREQLKSILQQERPALSQLHAQLASERAELAALPTFDEAQTRAILAKYSDANLGLAVEREKLRIEIFTIMTPAQKQKVEDLRSRFGGSFDERLESLADKL